MTCQAPAGPGRSPNPACTAGGLRGKPCALARCHAARAGHIGGWSRAGAGADFASSGSRQWGVQRGKAARPRGAPAARRVGRVARLAALPAAVGQLAPGARGLGAQLLGLRGRRLHDRGGRRLGVGRGGQALRRAHLVQQVLRARAAGLCGAAGRVMHDVADKCRRGTHGSGHARTAAVRAVAGARRGTGRCGLPPPPL